MRNFFISVVLILSALFYMSINSCSAIEDIKEIKKSIKFIYLNGSNANNEKARLDYTKGAYAMQKAIKQTFEQDKFICEKLLLNNTYTIDQEPEVFFWGFQSRKELSSVNDTLSIAKLVSPRIAQSLRSLLAHCMHDAVWVQKGYNMPRVINQLHKSVLEANNQGKKIVLSGHSAGSFVTYEYILHKLKAIDIKNLDKNNLDNFSSYCTCLDAIIDSKLGYQLANGRLILNPDKEQRKKAYLNLELYTSNSCAPDNSIAGIINFGSPLALFYSSQISGNLASSSLYQFYFVKYLQKNNIFFLTINYADDPIGFPVGNNLSASDIEMEFNKNLDKDGQGFMYNYSSKKSPATFVGSHFSYWKYPQKYADMAKEAYIKGYMNFYSKLDI